MKRSPSIILAISMLAVSCHAAQTIAYVGSFSAGQVNVVDVATRTVRNTITVGSQPQGVAVQPGGAFVFVCNSGANTVSVIDTQTELVISTITVGNSPLGVAFSPDGKTAYVANAGTGGGVSVIDTATLAVLATVTPCNNAQGIDVSPDGSKVYVSDNAGAKLNVIDTATNTVTASIPVVMNALGTAVRPDGAVVYVCNAQSATNLVSVIDTASNTVLTSIPVGSVPYGVVFSPDGTRAYVSNINGSSISVIDAAAHTVITTIPVGPSPIGVAVTPDGSELYVASSSANALDVISTATNTVAGNVNGLAAGPNSLGKFIGSIPNPPLPKGSGLNVGQGREEVENPLNGVGISIASSNGGVVQLAVDVTTLDRALTAAQTDFGDIPGRSSLKVPGKNPAHQFTQPGIFVATSRGVDPVTKVEKGKMRRMLAISARETGASGALLPPADATIALKSMKGKFFFSGTKTDSVSFTGLITMPAGLDLSRPDGQTLTVGIGNIIDAVTVSPKGKATLPGSAGIVKKLSVKFPRLAKGTTTTAGGEKAQIQFTFSAAGLTGSGFDTEGITTTLAAGEDAKKGAPRLIQLALVLAGVAYEGTAPVTFKVAKKGDSGQIAGRSSAR